jgi:hypothetical protein
VTATRLRAEARERPMASSCKRWALHP